MPGDMAPGNADRRLILLLKPWDHEGIREKITLGETRSTAFAAPFLFPRSTAKI
jgi:hypothetical protein